MAKTIRNLLPTALATLAQPTPVSPTFIKASRSWLAGSGWAYVGNETDAELKILEEGFSAVVEWFGRFLEGQEPTWITLVGPSGLGKTMLVKRICHYIEAHGNAVHHRTVQGKIPAMQRTASDLFSAQQRSHPFKTWEMLVPHNDDNRARLEDHKRNWFAAIDELKPQTGEERNVPSGDGFITAVIPKRFEVTAADDLANRRLRKWTMITSNLSRQQIAVCWDVRIASRLTRDGNVLVDLTGVRDFGLRIDSMTRNKKH